MSLYRHHYHHIICPFVFILYHLSPPLPQVYEETLRTKYESMVHALQEKVKAEQESRMVSEWRRSPVLTNALLGIVAVLCGAIHDDDDDMCCGCDV